VTFVETHRHAFGVAPLLTAIGEPVSTFYDRTSRQPSARAVADAAVAERIEVIWERSRRSYGAPRIHAMLAREGVGVGRKRVERLMRQLGIAGAHLHKHWKTTRQDRGATAAPDLVERDFTAAAPNMLWVADLTYIKTLQGILYLAVVLDVFSRKVVGWQMADTMTTDLVLSALEMGLWRRDVVRDRLIHHSDKGSQYTSLRFHPTPRRRRRGTLHRIGRRQLRQRHGRIVLRQPENRADLPAHLDQPARCRAGDLRLDRRLVQPGTHHRRTGNAQPRRIRSSVLR
jgi:transposase InsO family protein